MVLLLWSQNLFSPYAPSFFPFNFFYLLGGKGGLGSYSFINTFWLQGEIFSQPGSTWFQSKTFGLSSTKNKPPRRNLGILACPSLQAREIQMKFVSRGFVQNRTGEWLSSMITKGMASFEAVVCKSRGEILDAGPNFERDWHIGVPGSFWPHRKHLALDSGAGIWLYENSK